MKFILSAVVVMLISLPGLADVQIKSWFVAGTKDCRKENVQILGNGDTFSILFNSFGPQLNSGGKSYAAISSCYVAVLLELPQKSCIYQMDQAMSGGIIKSSQSWGEFHSNTRLNGLDPIRNRASFARNDEIRPEDPDSILLFQGSRDTHCFYSRYQWYTLDMLFMGFRASKSEFFLGTIDSTDSEVRVRLRTR